MTSEEAEAKAKEIESSITSKDGSISRQSNPIAKTLSYPIKKRASGFLGVLEFQLEPERLLELKESIAKDGKIVRHMVIIKRSTEPKQARRTRIKPAPAFTIEKKIGKTSEVENLDAEKEEKPASTKASIKEKVELKDIEQELEEILGE